MPVHNRLSAGILLEIVGEVDRTMPRTRYFPNRLPPYTPSESVKSQIDQCLSFIIDALSSIPSDGGLYTGRSGVAYMLYYLCRSDCDFLSKKREEYLKIAKFIYESELKAISKTKPSKDDVSIFFGSAGIHALGCFLYANVEGSKGKSEIEKNIQSYASLSDYCLKADFLSCGSDELFVGRAGYLSGILALKSQLGIKVLDDAKINAICSIMIESGKEFARRHRLRAPLMYSYYNTQYLGAAHGISSILQMILSCSSFLKSHPQEVGEVKACVDWLLTLQEGNGNFAPAMDEVSHPRPESEELVHWCHGAPGVVYLFAKAYLVWEDKRYLQACVRCAELTWEKGLLKKGPGICHGVAGSGYVFLLLYRLTKDEKYLQRAHQFARFMFTEEFQTGARCPDNPYSLYEGWAGTVCFLVDLLQPEKAEFPLFNVF